MSAKEQKARNIAMQLFAELQHREWVRVAARYDHSELAAFKRAQLENFLSLFTDTSKDGEDLARYVVDPFLLLPEIGSHSVIGWPAIGTIQQLVDLSPPSFFALYLEVAQETFGDLDVPREVVAVASESDDLIHVLYRRDQEAVQKAHRRFARIYATAYPWAVNVLPMRCSGESFAVLPNYDLNGELLSKILRFLERDSRPAG
jgi:hypothetical protein